MSIEFSEEDGGKAFFIRASGTLGKEDYSRFMPAIERSIGVHRQVRLLVDMAGFQGWDAAGLWEEIKGEVKYSSAIQRCAVVGAHRWEQAVSELGKPFLGGDLRFFEPSALDEARRWMKEGDGARLETGRRVEA